MCQIREFRTWLPPEISQFPGLADEINRMSAENLGGVNRVQSGTLSSAELFDATGKPFAVDMHLPQPAFAR